MPVFDINLRDVFPMPTLEQGSPLGGVLSNAIAKRLAMANAQKAEKEVPYAGLSKLAEVLSKSAYANAVMPQISNKAASNPAVWAQLSDEQKRALALSSASTVSGQQNIFTPLMNKAMEIYQQENQGKPGIFQGLMNAITGNNQPTQSSNPTPIFQSPANVLPAVNPVGTNTSNMSNKDAVQYANSHQQGAGAFPVETPTPPAAQPVQPSLSSPETMTPDEKIAKFQAMQENAKAAGKTFGVNQENAINDLNNQYWQSSQYLSVLQEMNKTITDPIFQDTVNVPFVSQHSLEWYKNDSSNPRRQELIGNFLAEQPQIVQNFVSQFKGQAMGKEIDLAQGSKVNKYDMPSVMVGKQQAITYLTTLANRRQELTADIMAKEGLREKDAFNKADKILKGENIRDKVYAELHPPKFSKSDITVENIQHTASQLGISVPEVIARLKKKGMDVPEGVINAR